MELHLVDAVAGAVEVVQRRRMLVGQARQVQRLGATQLLAQRPQRLGLPACALAQHRLAQRGVRRVQVEVLQGRDGIAHLMGIERVIERVHGGSPVRG